MTHILTHNCQCSIFLCQRVCYFFDRCSRRTPWRVLPLASAPPRLCLSHSTALCLTLSTLDR